MCLAIRLSYTSYGSSTKKKNKAYVIYLPIFASVNKKRDEVVAVLSGRNRITSDQHYYFQLPFLGTNHCLKTEGSRLPYVLLRNK